MHPHDSRPVEPSSIRDAIDRGMSDEDIVALIIEHTRVTDSDARQILAREKGKHADDTIDEAER